MFGKGMFYRMFKPPMGTENQHAETLQWEVEYDKSVPVVPHGDATTIPLHTWNATKENPMADISETTLIPQYRPALHDNAVVHRIENAYNDVDAKCKAANALLMGDINTALAGLIRYAELHPVAV